MKGTREQVLEFKEVYESILSEMIERKGNKTKAYEAAEAYWIAKYGERKYKDRDNFGNMKRKSPIWAGYKHYSPIQKWNNRFFEIYFYLADPLSTNIRNFRRAQQVYRAQYGKDRFHSYSAFWNRLRDYQQSGRLKLRA